MVRTELEDLWRQRVQDARLHWDFARIHAQEVRSDLPQLSSSNGDFAVHRAVRLENLALAQYRRVLRTYSELVVDGRVPDERKRAGQ